MLGRPLQPRFFGFATVPADNASNGGSPMVVTPPANMVSGDLTWVSFLRAGAGPETASIPVTGGQSWTLTQDRNTSLPEIWTAWCTFNGTWSANPQFAITGTSVAKSAQMFVVRSNKVGAVWAVDQYSSLVTTSVGGGVFDQTITGVTNTNNRVVTIARAVVSVSGYTYSSHTPLNWIWMGGQNFRNTGSNNKNILYGYLYQPIGGATGDLTFTGAIGSSTAYKNMHSFYYT